MNKIVYELLEVHHKMIEENVNTWNPRQKELLERSEELIDLLKNGTKREVKPVDYSYSNWKYHDQR